MNPPTLNTEPKDASKALTFGDCADCGCRHSLAAGRAREYALDLMRRLSQLGRLDDIAAESDADPKLRLKSLFEARGSMFGVLECLDADGETVFLRAFSSLAGGIRDVPGWVLPVLSAQVYKELILPEQDEIKRLTAEIEGARDSGQSSAPLEQERREVSRALWKKMCSEYHFQNFRGEVRTLAQAVIPGSSITGGMGECCAPKLLNHAARNRLRPQGIAEFYWRGDSGSRDAEDQDATSKLTSGTFYPSCEARCQPLLGFLLCGLEQ